MNEAFIELIGKQLGEARDIRVVSHVRPDGDAVGSVIGLGLALKFAGKPVEMILSDGVPTVYRHLTGADLIRKEPRIQADYIVTLDCSDLQRVGNAVNGDRQPDLNIDHHVTNENFARINLVDPNAVSTTAILTQHLKTWGLPITLPIAEALLTGLITDSLGFRTANMNPQALRIAADLMEMGADLPKLYNEALHQRSFQAARLWGAGLERLQHEGRLAWTSLTKADRAAIGYRGKDDAELVNFLATIKDHDIVVIFVEQPNGRVKVSWRAEPGFDISILASRFGGGGHPAAAGAEITGEMESVEEMVLQTTKTYLDQAESIEKATELSSA